LVLGVAIPYLADYFRPQVLTYVALPPSSQIWEVFVVFGVLSAIVGFLQNAYINGQIPWLLGKLGGGAVSLALFSYVFLFLPNTLVAASQSFQATGLLLLAYAAIILSYLYLILDFMQHRRRLKFNPPQDNPF